MAVIEVTCVQCKQALFNITKYVTDGLGAYQRLLSYELHEEGMRNTKK